jgi:DNA (cytosine-5)-methyltransferase 1
MTATNRTRETKPRPIAVDLFCGAGGMSLGMERAGFDIVFAIDYDGYHVAAHERNFPYGKTKCGSVQDLTGESIRLQAGIDKSTDVDLVFGGPPCQGFSAMGLRDAGDPRNTLIFQFARIVDELRPKAFVMENVTGLNMGSTQPIFEAFLNAVSRNYTVTLPVQVLTATDFGVPQARKRLFVIGIRTDIGEGAVYPRANGRSKVPTVSQAISDLPQVENQVALFDSDLARYDRRPRSSQSYALMARGLCDLQNDFSHIRTWDTSVVAGCQRVRHTAEAIALYGATAPGETVPGHKLPRLHPDGVCPTLRAGATSERGSHTAPRPVHPSAPRVITAREAARLHGYPDWFSFYPAKMHAYRQIGNSVCPPVAHAVGLSVMKALGVNPAQLDRRLISLTNDFVLPPERPSQHARIPVKVEYPKIINHLWARAFDSSRNRLNSPRFTADDIRDAIAATNANLPRVRPERFLFEAGQQRAIRQILAVPLSHGYSVAITDKEAGSGVFQRAELPNSLGRQTSIIIRSPDLNRALPFSAPGFALNSSDEILGQLERPTVLSHLTHGKWERLQLAKDLFGQPIATDPVATVHTKQGKQRKALVYVAEGSSIPFDRLRSRMEAARVRTSLVFMVLTKVHFAVVVVRLSAGTITEVSRTLFCAAEAPLTTGAL